jgi:hypothetical protein
MSASKTDREPSSNLPHVTRRSRTECDTEPPAPRLARVTGEIKLEAPPDCTASVIFKQVDRGADGRDVYVFWFLVGRRDGAAMMASYKCATGDIRCDIPVGAAPMSSASLQPYLDQFLRSSIDDPQALEGLPPTLDP